MSEHVTDEAVEKAAKAMADDWNPERDPILSAMFRDYAATALEAAAPLIAAKALRDAATRIPSVYTRSQGGPSAWLSARADRIEAQS